MSAARKIERWDPESVTIVESDREYIETEGVYYSEEVGSYYQVHAPLYLDPLTGLVVFDVATYERWVR